MAYQLTSGSRYLGPGYRLLEEGIHVALVIILIMAGMAAILRGLAISNEGDARGL